LIVSDDAEFGRTVTVHWQNEAHVPAFTLMSGDLCHDLDRDAFDVAIVGAVRPEILPLLLNALDPGNKPVLLVCDNVAQSRAMRAAHSPVLLLVQHAGWLDEMVMIVAEILRRQESVARIRQLAQTNTVLERQAALGSYILEMRHTLNNALTSILGNTELLLLDLQPLPPGSRTQIETVRNMAVRIHEILARFTSIDKELSALERQPQEAGPSSRSQAAGASF
jgi:signal transduction histidine kinase